MAEDFGKVAAFRAFRREFAELLLSRACTAAAEDHAARLLAESESVSSGGRAGWNCHGVLAVAYQDSPCFCGERSEELWQEVQESFLE